MTWITRTSLTQKIHSWVELGLKISQPNLQTLLLVDLGKGQEGTSGNKNFEV